MKNNFLIVIALTAISFFSNAQSWGTFGNGANKAVYAMKPYNNGLIVSGNFDTLNSYPMICMAYYKDNTGYYYWSDELSKNYKSAASYPFFSSAYIDAIEVFDNRIHIGGEFFYPYYSDKVNIGYLEDNSSSWDFNIYYSNLSQEVYALKSFNNKLFIGGSYSNFVGTNHIAYINSMSYPSPFPSTPGSGLNGTVFCLEVYNGALYAGGSFTSSGTTTLSNLAKWDGTSWTNVGGGINGTVFSLTPYNGALIVGGTFSQAGSTAALNVAKWNGTSWSALGNGIYAGQVNALKVYNNNLYAGGHFFFSGTTPVNYIAKWNGTTWSALGSGLNGKVNCLEVCDNKLFVGGEFTTANGSAANHIAYYSETNGVNEGITQEKLIKVIPNPASDVISIETPLLVNESSLIIYNITGQIVLSKLINYNDTKLDISNLQNGVYFVKIITDKETSCVKIIKE